MLSGELSIRKEIEAAYMGNAVAGLMTGQEMIRGQVTLSAMGFDQSPIYNVESACASSSSAFQSRLDVSSLGYP